MLPAAPAPKVAPTRARSPANGPSSSGVAQPLRCVADGALSVAVPSASSSSPSLAAPASSSPSSPDSPSLAAKPAARKRSRESEPVDDTHVAAARTCTKVALVTLGTQLRDDLQLRRELERLQDARLMSAAVAAGLDPHSARVNAAMALILGDATTRERVASHLHDVRRGAAPMDARVFGDWDR